MIVILTPRYLRRRQPGPESKSGSKSEQWGSSVSRSGPDWARLPFSRVGERSWSGSSGLRRN